MKDNPRIWIELDAFDSRPGKIQKRLNVALLLLRRGENVEIRYFHERPLRMKEPAWTQAI
jgi:hypothetical protein